MEVTVTAEKLKQPARLGNFGVRVCVPSWPLRKTRQEATHALSTSLLDSQHSARATRDQDRVGHRRGVRIAKLTIPTNSWPSLERNAQRLSRTGVLLIKWQIWKAFVSLSYGQMRNNSTAWKAAKELHFTHPAVSPQIKALEEAIGMELFDRSGLSAA